MLDEGMGSEVGTGQVLPVSGLDRHISPSKFV